MNYFIAYASGFVIVYVYDKVVSGFKFRSWRSLLNRIGLASLSWFSVFMFLYLLIMDYIGDKLDEKNRTKPSRWI